MPAARRRHGGLGSLHADLRAVGQHVVHRRAGDGLVHDLAQLLGRRVAADGEADADRPVAVADLVGDAEDAAQVDVTPNGGLYA